VFLTLIVVIATLSTLPHSAPAELWFQLLSARLPLTFGMFVSVISALALLAGALHRDKPESLLPLVLSLLGGLLLLSPNWLMALSLVVLALGVLTRELFRRPPPSAGESPTSPV
jgi:hypothetical protein